MGGGAYFGALLLQGGASYRSLFFVALLTGLVAEATTLSVRAERVDLPRPLGGQRASDPRPG